MCMNQVCGFLDILLVVSVYCSVWQQIELHKSTSGHYREQVIQLLVKYHSHKNYITKYQNWSILTLFGEIDWVIKWK